MSAPWLSVELLVVSRRLDVFLNGNRVGRITLEPFVPVGDLELNSQDGAMVPPVGSGSLVVLKLCDKAILAGVF